MVVKDGSMKDGANSMWTDITKKGEKWKLANKTRADWADKQPDAEASFGLNCNSPFVMSFNKLGKSKIRTMLNTRKIKIARTV